VVAVLRGLYPETTAHPAWQTQAVAAVVLTCSLLLLRQVVRVLLSFVTLAHRKAQAVLLHHPAATQSTRLHLLVRTQHNMATTKKPAVKAPAKVAAR
jgi:hypothetical protein